MTAEEFGAVAAAAAADGVFALDADDRVVYANDAIRDALGRVDPTGPVLAALPDTTRLSEETVADVATAAGRARLSGDTVSVTLRPTDDDDTAVGECRLRAADDPRGTVVGVVRDVTEQHERQAVVRSLHTVTRQLYDADGPEAVCSVAVHAATHVLDLPFSGVWLLDEAHDRLEPVAASAAAHDELGGLPRFERGEGLVWEAFTRGESQLYEDVSTHDDVFNPATTIRSELIVPIGSHGVLMAGSTTSGELDEVDRDLAELLATNTDRVLDRLDRNARLSERDHSIDHMTDRLASVDAMLTDGLLPAVLPALSSLSTDRERDVYRYVDGVTELVGDGLSLGPMTEVELSTAVHDAVSSLDTDAVTVVLDGDATLRADRKRLTALFEWFVESALVRASEGTGRTRSPWSRDRHWPDGGRSEVAVRVDLLGPGSGFRLADDVPVDERGLPGPGTAGGVGQAVARGIAMAHGWDPSVTGDESGRRLVVSGVTTLSRLGE